MSFPSNHIFNLPRMSSASNKSDFSAPWKRATFINSPAYIASENFLSHVQWSKTGNQDDLVTTPAPDDPKEIALELATCAVVGTVSRNKLFLEPQGNYNPTYIDLENSKTQFQIISPTAFPEFAVDFDRAVAHMETLQKRAIKDGPEGAYFVVTDSLKKALKFSSPLFEKRVFQSNNIYPSTDLIFFVKGVRV
jgi:hypothetical protein